MPNKHSIPYCPSCDHEISKAEVNIKEGVALCDECGLLSQLSDLDYLKAPAQHTLKQTPNRVKVTSDRDHIKIRISLFSILPLFGSLFAMLFWNGIVSLFLSLAVAAVSYNVVGYVPDWLPVPGLEDTKPVMNGEVMGVWATVFICLFLTPFLVVGAFLIINTALRFCGSTVVVIDKHHSYVSTGIFFLRLRKKFEPRKVKSVQAIVKATNQNQVNYVIAMDIKGRKKSVKFGGSLSNAQREWLVTILRKILVQKQASSLSSDILHLYWLK